MANSAMFLSQNADEQFKEWAVKYPESFYINIKSQNSARLHKANCWHLGAAEGVNSTSNSKICANDVEELYQWARDNELELEKCADCL